MTSTQIQKWFKDHSDFPAVVFHDAVAFPPVVYDLASEKRYNEFIRAISSFGPKIEVKTMTYAGVEREVLKFDAESSKAFIEDSDTDTPRFTDADDIRDLFKGEKKPYRELTDEEKKEAARLGKKIISMDGPAILKELAEVVKDLEEEDLEEDEDEEEDEDKDDLEEDEEEIESDEEEEIRKSSSSDSLEEEIIKKISDTVHPSNEKERKLVAKLASDIIDSIIKRLK